MTKRDLQEMPPLARAIRMALRETGITATELAERLGGGWSISRVSTYMNSRAPGLKEIAAMERALGLPLGWIARHAGYVEESNTLKTFLANDETISEDTKEMIRNVYEAGQRTYAGQNRLPSGRAASGG